MREKAYTLSEVEGGVCTSCKQPIVGAGIRVSYYARERRYHPECVGEVLMREDREVTNCPDCGVAPGQTHLAGCDVERCSVCGSQWIACGCKGHDPQFARWTGFWPGAVEAAALKLDLNRFDARYARVFFVKPGLPADDKHSD